MRENRILPEDTVQVDVLYEGALVYYTKATGFSTVEEAIGAAIEKFTQRSFSIETYTYRVTNISNRTSGLYRFDADGRLVEIPPQKLDPETFLR